MAFTPDSPFPKTRGHVIKSKDWNDAVTEVQRLDAAKVNKSGDGITGPLTIGGNLGIKNTNPQRPLQIGTDVSGVGLAPADASPNAGYVRWGDNTGWKLHFGRSREGSNGALNVGTTGVLMTLQDNGNVGIGTVSPGARLQVSGGAIMPAVGNSAAAGIQFPSDPGGGGGDQAFIRYFVESGETTKLLIGNQNDADDRVSFYQFGGERLTIYNGNVGIGTASPGARLEVNGDIAISGKHAFRGSDPWLRLNQDGAFTAGVHTPGVFAPMSLNVGGYNGWGNPGGGNAWITGSVTIAGNLGTHGFPPSARTPGWGGGIRTYDLEVEATAWIRNGVQTGNRDLAENFASDVDLDPGDVVCMGDDEESVAISEEPDDGLVLGVVSSRPGLLLNSDHDSDDGGRMFPIALCGRVPCKVVDENGPIQRGDLLTSSSTPGHAMKATSVTIDGQPIHRPGTIIGKAVGSLRSGTGTIEVFVIAR